ncbi:arylamine N-acetyltransferase 1 [Mycena olivaceomarginata]|nr:arylamine N-acetyltransferase 1 [Mycena olivaceomarginata]
MSFPADPYAQAKLNRADAGAYLERIKLPATLLDSPPSLSLLSTLFLSHLEEIPKDTSPLHVPEEQWDGPSTPIKLSSAFTNMPLGASAFDRIVHENKGAFCFSINASFASFLRYFGFTISELVGRVVQVARERSDDTPRWMEVGDTHAPAVGCGYLIDGAWGPWNLAKPIKLTTDAAGETILGLNDFEAYRLSYEELPLSPHMTPPVDNIPGYTLYRRIAPVGTPHALPITPNSPGYWSPLFHFLPVSVPLADFALYHHFSASHEMASFTARRGRARGRRCIRRVGRRRRGATRAGDVEWVEMDTGTVKAYLTKEFGFKF